MVEPRLRAVVEAKLALRWSPQQIAGWLPLAYPQDPVIVGTILFAHADLPFVQR